MLTSKVTAVASALLAQSALSQVTASGYSLAVSYDAATQEAVFNMEILDNTWFGFGLGSKVMGRGVDSVMCKVTSAGAGLCEDMRTNGYGALLKDDTENITSTFTAGSAGTTNVEVRRSLDTGDTAHDYLI